MRKRIENYLNIRKLRAKYHRASPKKKSKILNEFCDLTGIHRKSLIRMLNRKPKHKKKRRGLKPKYQHEEMRAVLNVIWLTSDKICSKKLKAIMPEWLPYYEHEHGELPEFLRLQLLSVSPATIDRILKKVKLKYAKRKKFCGTKPGKILKNQIPIRSHHWDDNEPGFLEADTVAHCGNSIAGDFVWSITFTDIHTTWTENRATWGKGAGWVVKRIKEVEIVLPFIIKGFDCDNGSEFLNYHLINYFAAKPKEQMVQFTRSRPYHKNDNAHVEQKNWTHVRQLLGYDRFDTRILVNLVNDLYENEWGLY